MARLVGQEGPVAGKTFPIDPGITLGREKHNDVAMPDNRKASRDHAKVWKEGPNRYAIADLGSTNGTLVNDGPITRTALQDGDLVRVGEALFRFELDEADKPKPKAKPKDDRPDLASVLRGESRPTTAPVGTGAGGAGAMDIEIKQRVLQYSRKENKGSAATWDVSQTGGLTRWMMILGALAVAAALFFVISNFIASSRQADSGLEDLEVESR